LIVNVEEKSIRLGSRRGITMSGIVIEAHIDEDRYHALGHSLVYLAIDKQLAGVIRQIDHSPRSQAYCEHLKAAQYVNRHYFR